MRNAFFAETILDFSGPIQGSGSGVQTLVNQQGKSDLDVGDAHEISGIIDCDTANCTVTLYWGYAHNGSTFNQANGQSNQVADGPILYDAAETPISLTFNSSYPTTGVPSSGGYKINPINVAGKFLCVTVFNSGTGAIAKFRMLLTKRRR